MFANLILGFGLTVSIAAYIVYFFAALKSIIPNRWSWLIWSAATAAEAITYNALNPNELQSVILGVAAVSTAAITLKIWTKSVWLRPTQTELVSVVICATAIALWVVFKLTWWAHILVVVAVPIAFIPTWKDAWASPNKESYLPWLLWSIGDGLTVLLTTIHLRNPFEELLYTVVEFLSHLTVFAIVILKRKKGGSV